MSDFILLGVDYINLIKNEEDMKKFERLKELEPLMHNIPISKILNEFKEYTKLSRELEGLPAITFIDIPKNIQEN